jgi:hypothetical protein
VRHGTGASKLIVRSLCRGWLRDRVSIQTYYFKMNISY